MSVRRLTAIAVSGLATVALLAVAAWMLLGGDSDESGDAAVQIISPGESVSVDAPAATEPPVEADQTDDATALPEITVYITGAVINPGVYSVTAEQRLNDVLALAGGPADDADLSRINLAAHLSDAAHYKIPSVQDPEPDPGPEPGDGGQTTPAETVPAAAACAVPININAATAECLETLPGIGGVRADAIVAHREQAGPFVTPEDIKAVSGIGDGIYRRIASMIAVADQ